MAIQLPGGVTSYLQTSGYIDGVGTADGCMIGIWIKPHTSDSSTSNYYMCIGRDGELPGNSAGYNGFTWSPGNSYNGVYSYDSAGNGRSSYPSELNNRVDEWTLVMLGKRKNASYRYVKWRGENEKATSNWNRSTRGLDFPDNTLGMQWGHSSENGKGSGIIDICHVFRIGVYAEEDLADDLAAGKTFAELGLTPTNWWKLSDKDDLTDYGTAGNDLVKHGSGFTTVPGPSVLQAENNKPTTELLSPADESTIYTTTPDFVFRGHDLDGDDLLYEFQIDTRSTFDSQVLD